MSETPILDRYGPLPWTDCLITPNARCVRHPDEPKAWCLEWRAISLDAPSGLGAGESATWG